MKLACLQTTPRLRSHHNARPARRERAVVAKLSQNMILCVMRIKHSHDRLVLKIVGLAEFVDEFLNRGVSFRIAFLDYRKRFCLCRDCS
jgi:hypothetical protein